MKSIYQRLGEATEKLADLGKFKQYTEAVKNATSVEAKLNAAERILAEPVKEAEPITKNNGRQHNGGELFTESAVGMTETIRTGDAALYNGLGISEAEQRKLAGLPPVGTKLTSNQLREFRFLRSIKLSEADALRGALKVA
jgi:hypothetical protein